MDWGLWNGFNWILFGNTLSIKSEAAVTSYLAVGYFNKAKMDAE